MGANFVVHTTSLESKKKVVEHFESLQSLAAMESGNSYSGEINMAPGLDFHREVFESYDQALEFLESKCEKWENANACQFKENNKIFYMIAALCSC